MGVAISFCGCGCRVISQWCSHKFLWLRLQGNFTMDLEDGSLSSSSGDDEKVLVAVFCKHGVGDTESGGGGGGILCRGCCTPWRGSQGQVTECREEFSGGI